MRHALLVVAAFVVSACVRQPVNTTPSGSVPASGAAGSATTGANAVGAATSKGAVEAFLTGVKATNLQAMSDIWGNEKGLVRDQRSRGEVEQRLIIIQCNMNHDKWSFTEDSPRLQTGGKQVWTLSLTRRNQTAKTTMTTVQGPGGRWFMIDADLTPLKDFCA